jgi:hypothetical protein
VIKKSLLNEYYVSINKQKVLAADPYTSDLANKLTPVEPPVNKGVADNITQVFGKQDVEGAFKDAASNDGFYSFVGTVKQAFQKAQPPILGSYEKSAQENEKPTDPPGKLAWLVGLAYYLEYVNTMKNNPKDNNFRAVPDFKNAMRIAKKLIRRMVSMGLKTLDINVKFTSDVAAAVCAVVWDKQKEEEGIKKKEEPKPEVAPIAAQVPPPAAPPVQAQPLIPPPSGQPQEQVPLAASKSYANLRLKKPFGLLD